MIHTIQETVRCGPLNLLAQWALENTVGNLGREVRQPSNAFSNLAERGLLRARQNALMAIMPELDICGHLPRGALSLGNGYYLLRASERNECSPTVEAEEVVIRKTFNLSDNDCVQVRKWARLLLPNQQVVRSLWRDGRAEDGQISHNVKLNLSVNGYEVYAEVLYYFTSTALQHGHAFAMVVTYSNPHPDFLSASHSTLWVTRNLGNLGLHVVDAKSIQSVVAMVPFVLKEEETNCLDSFNKYKDCVCMVEKPFLAIVSIHEELGQEENVIENYKIDLLHILLDKPCPLNSADAERVSDKLFSLGFYAIQSANTILVNAARNTVCKCASASTTHSLFELASTSTAYSSFHSSFENSSPDNVIQHFSLPGSPNQNYVQESQTPDMLIPNQNYIHESQTPDMLIPLQSSSMGAYTQRPLIQSLEYCAREKQMPNIDPPMSTDITELFDLCHELVLHWNDTDFCRKAKRLLVKAAVDPEAPVDTETERYLSRQLSNMASLALGGILCTEYCDGMEYPILDKSKLIHYTKSALRHLTMADRMIDSLMESLSENPLKKRKPLASNQYTRRLAGNTQEIQGNSILLGSPFAQQEPQTPSFPYHHDIAQTVSQTPTYNFNNRTAPNVAHMQYNLGANAI
ncbi:hypothetical protein JOM56_015128 [Amanita muscaria]